MHHGAARIALLAYVFGGLLLPMTHRHAAPAGAAAAIAHVHHDGHCHASSGCAAEEPVVPLAEKARIAAAADAAAAHQCHGACALCLAAGQMVTLPRQVALERHAAPRVIRDATEWSPPHAVRLLRANLLRGPPALLS